MKELNKKAYEPLDKYEEELIDYLENSDFNPKELSLKRKEKLQNMAKDTLDKVEEKKRISINIKVKDLNLLKQKAKESSIPYQNLIQALVNNYVQGKIKLDI